MNGSTPKRRRASNATDQRSSASDGSKAANELADLLSSKPMQQEVNGATEWVVPCPLHDPEGTGRSPDLIIQPGRTRTAPMVMCRQCGEEAWPDLIAALKARGVPPHLLPESPARPQRRAKVKIVPLVGTGDTEPISERKVSRWHDDLLNGGGVDGAASLRYLQDKRGLSLEAIKAAQLGWNGRRITIPVRDVLGRLVNVRLHNRAPGAGQPKMINYTVRRKDSDGAEVKVGWGSPPRLYGVDRLVQLTPGQLVLFTAGEFDALLTEQQTGLPCVSSTGGEQVLPRLQDLVWLAAHDVSVIYDCDSTGRAYARAVADALLEHQLARSIKVVELGDPKHWDNGEDLTDWFMTARYTSDALQKKINGAPLHDSEDGGDVVWLSDIEEAVVEWLWDGRIPFGKISIIEGDPDGGKSTLTLDLAARATAGRAMPGTDNVLEPSNVVLVGAEDDLADTVRPRLRVAGGDLARVATLKVQRDEKGNVVPLTIPDDLDRLRRLIKKAGAKLVIVDPITAYLGENINTSIDASVRRALAPLKELAEETGAAIVLVRHLNKSGDARAIYRGGGSIAFSGAARSVLLAAPHPEVPGQMVLARVKGNLTQRGPAIEYQVMPSAEPKVPCIEWGEPMNIDADTLLRGKDARKDAPALEAAEVDLKEILRGGEVRLQKEVMKLMKEAGHTEKATRNAAKSLGVEKVPSRNEGGFGIKGWNWSLPETNEDGVEEGMDDQD